MTQGLHPEGVTDQGHPESWQCPDSGWFTNSECPYVTENTISWWASVTVCRSLGKWLIPLQSSLDRSGDPQSPHHPYHEPRRPGRHSPLWHVLRQVADVGLGVEDLARRTPGDGGNLALLADVELAAVGQVREPRVDDLLAGVGEILLVVAAEAVIQLDAALAGAAVGRSRPVAQLLLGMVVQSGRTVLQSRNVVLACVVLVADVLILVRVDAVSALTRAGAQWLANA